MSEPTLSNAALQQLPLFPLPSSVLFPGMALPLYVFEPRYRNLVRHCLDGDGGLAIPLLQPGYEPDYHDQPDIFPVMGAGLIVAQEELADGCWNIVVLGTDRVHCRHELPPTHAFRRVVANRLGEQQDEHTAEADKTLRALLLHLAESSPDGRESLLRLLELATGAGRLADLVAAATLSEARERQEILEELDVTARVRRVTEQLAARYLDGPPGDEGLPT